MHIKKVSILFWSAVLTKILEAFVAVHGWFITQISWNLAFLIFVLCTICIFNYRFAKGSYLQIISSYRNKIL